MIDKKYYNRLIKRLFPRIKLIYPTVSAVNSIYVTKDKYPRWFCIIRFNDKTKKHTQLARLLLEIKLMRVLDRQEHETVDHIDGETLNNSFRNLQMLSLSDNARKGPNDKVKAVIKQHMKDTVTYKKGDEHPMFGIPNTRNNGSKHLFSKLTDDDVKYIRSFTYTRSLYNTLAEQFNCSATTIMRAFKGKTYF